MRKELKLPTTFLSLFLLSMLTYLFSIGNYEFIGYVVVIVLLWIFLIKIDKGYNLPVYTFWLVFVWVLSHLLGGSVYISGTKLYDLVLVPIFNGGGELVIMKYDQLIHAYCYFVVSIILYYILKKNFKNPKATSFFVFVVLSSIGIGLLNEVIEFGMVLFAGAAEAVGGYYNTALDLVFNLIGAVIGVLWVGSRD